ncbi:40S ribosomal protein S8e [Aspergillus stella-maris]|uniref:40S ribosomal protein S8e n=1 Tax=Aspergillus stella-maris TaxID=1810926 RepID=UPI003CCCAE75
MGISRDSRHKRSATGAKRAYYRKKRAFEKGRQPANTRIGTKRIHLVRTRGGNQKFRALRLESGNFSWGSEGVSRKTRVIVVAYHPSNNELVRTNTLTKSAVVQIDAAPFRQWYEAHYGQPIGRRRQQKTEATEEKKSNSVEKKQAARFAESGKVESAIERQFESGRLYAVIASRPGQSGRVDGYILEGDELAFYQRAIRKIFNFPDLDLMAVLDSPDSVVLPAPVRSLPSLRPHPISLSSIQTYTLQPPSYHTLTSTIMPKTTKTRLLLLSDTHTTPPAPPHSSASPYRSPLPNAKILLHAGDITKVGLASEHISMLDVLKAHPAELKIVIAGNHDITLDEEYYTKVGWLRHRTTLESPAAIKALYTSPDALAHGIIYMEEETRTFRLPSTGAKFTVYASPYTPEFCAWAFAYPRSEDRFNPSSSSSPAPAAPISDYPGVDICLTHGPPMGVLDRVVPSGESVGCEHLFRAVRRAKPALHVFGHIHEGYGAKRVEWEGTRSQSQSQSQSCSLSDGAGTGPGFETEIKRIEDVPWDREDVMDQRGAYVDLTSDSKRPLRRGEETVFVNASVVTVKYEGLNAPWVVDLDLQIDEGEGGGL